MTPFATLLAIHLGNIKSQSLTSPQNISIRYRWFHWRGPRRWCVVAWARRPLSYADGQNKESRLLHFRTMYAPRQFNCHATSMVYTPTLNGKWSRWSSLRKILEDDSQNDRQQCIGLDGAGIWRQRSLFWSAVVFTSRSRNLLSGLWNTRSAEHIWCVIKIYIRQVVLLWRDAILGSTESPRSDAPLRD